MSNFYAFDFIFDDIPSQTFDIKIMSLDSGGVVSGVGSSDVNIITQRVLRKSKPYYLGRTQEPVLEFPLMFGSPNEIDAIDRDIISKWLFGRKGYKKLYILQDDMQGLYFNCFMTKPEPIYIGNLNYAFKCSVTCDSPWAYGEEKIFTQELNNESSEFGYFEIYNASSEDDYLYPTVTIRCGLQTEVDMFLGYLSTYNQSDNNRNSKIIDMYKGDTIIINNDLQIITNTTLGGYKYITNFNKRWWRLRPGLNKYKFTAKYLNSFEFKYTERFKIGG